MTRDEDEDDEEEEGLVFFPWPVFVRQHFVPCTTFLNAYSGGGKSLSLIRCTRRKQGLYFAFSDVIPGVSLRQRAIWAACAQQQPPFFLFRSDETETRDAQVMTQERGNESIQKGQVPNADRT